MVSIPRCAMLALAVVASACTSLQRDGASAICVENEAALLSLDYEAFDQDPGGWRKVARTEGCGHAAAALIATWREKRAGILPPNQMQTLWWHEGQVLATAGDYEAAISRIETSRNFRDDRPPPPDAPADAVETWSANIAVHNAWEDATLAFLRRDRTKFGEARAKMLAVPEPAGYAQFQDLFEKRTGTRMAWPLNIENVDLMLACFDHRYGVDCRKPGAR
jgi:hypothetical protein